MPGVKVHCLLIFSTLLESHGLCFCELVDEFEKAMPGPEHEVYKAILNTAEPNPCTR